jgi:O-antigen/teichoic acid export membrane protein
MDKTTSVDITDTFQAEKSDSSILLAAKGGGIVFGGAIFNYGSQFLLGILLTRFLGAELYGQYKVALIAGEMAAGFALLGLDCAMVRFIALFASRRDTPGLWGTLQLGMGLVIIAGLIIGAGLYALASPLASYVFHEPQLVPLLHLASLIVPFSALTNVLASATMGFNKMQYNVGARQIVQPLIRLLLIILLVAFGLTARKAMIPYIAGLVVSSALLVYFLNHLFPLNSPLKTARRDTREIILFSLPAYFSSMIITFGPSLQTVLLGSLNTMATVGIFAVANQVSTASTLFNQSIGTASSPIVSELHGSGDRLRMAHFYQTTAKWMFTVNLPMFLVVILLSKPILAIFGKEFLVGSTALTILALSNLVVAAAGVSDGALAMTGNTSVKLINSAVQTVFSIGLCFLLIPRWGAVGAALAVMISSTIIHILLVSEMFVLFRMLPYTLGLLKPVAAGLVALILGWIVRQVLHIDTNLLFAVINGFAVLGVYAGMILLLGLSKEDKIIFSHFVKRAASVFERR